MLTFSVCAAHAQNPQWIWIDTGIPGSVVAYFPYYVNGEQYFQTLQVDFTYDRYFATNPSYNKVVLHMPHGDYTAYGVISDDQVRQIAY